MPWAIEKLGINSKQFSGGQTSDPEAFKGKKWRFAGDTQPKKDQAKVEAEKIEKARLKEVEAKKESEKIEFAGPAYSEKQLKQLGAEELKAIAGSYGIAKLKVSKDELIKAILGKQG